MNPVKAATINDVAALAGVSAGTVSNVLNRPWYVSPPVRDRVSVAIAKLGYKPRESARQFRPGRVKNVGLVLADMGNPFFMEIALGAESVARKTGVGIVICHSAEDAEREAENFELLVQQRVQGFIVAQVDESRESSPSPEGREIPIVYVDRVAESTDHCSITIDEVRGGMLIGEYLRSKGHKLIAFAGDITQNPKVAARYRGVVQAFSSRSTSVLSVPINGWNLQSGREAAAAILAFDTRPSAIACANDMVALGMIQELSRAGVRVPENISVVGYDDLAIAEATAVPLTTVKQPRAMVGEQAMRMLLEEIDHAAPHSHRHIVMEPSLVIRQSA